MYNSSKNKLQFSDLSHINKKTHKLSEVQHRLEKVAFDIVRFKDEDKDACLWQIQQADDGNYIVALYEDNSDDQITVKSDWDVVFDNKSNNLTISYKQDPLFLVNAKRLGISQNELSHVLSYLPEKLQSNKKLAKSLLEDLKPAIKAEVLAKYPELK